MPCPIYRIELLDLQGLYAYVAFFFATYRAMYETASSSTEAPTACGMAVGLAEVYG